MSATLEELPGEHRWTFAGHRVTQLVVELRSIRLLAWSLQASLELRVSAPFTLAHADGTERRVDPVASEQLGPLLTLVGRELRGLAVTRAGALRAEFGDGTSFDVHPRRDAFEVQGGGALEGVHYVAGPDGAAAWE